MSAIDYIRHLNDIHFNEERVERNKKTLEGVTFMPI
jgi:hypothetical protein